MSPDNIQNLIPRFRCSDEMPKQRYQEPKLKQTTQGVWFIRPWVDVVKGNCVTRAKRTIPLGRTGKREAQAKAREIMATINRADYVVTSQINVGRFLDEYASLHVERLAASTQEKYSHHIKNHIRPSFGHMRLCDMEPLLVQRWLDAKAGDPGGGGRALAWSTRTDIRNILSSMFTKAIEWGRWKDRNPVANVHAGRKRLVREKRKLTDEQTRRLLAHLPSDVRLMCSVCLFCTLRISEALGLQEKHLNFRNGVISIRQRFYRGDLDVPKNQKSIRDVPMGFLASEMKALCMGDPERFVFQTQTHPERKKPTVCRDDRDINQHFLRPAAKDLGFYWVGFGFHALRREAVTALNSSLGTTQAMRMAGHSSVDMSLEYTLSDLVAQDRAVRERQSVILRGVCY